MSATESLRPMEVLLVEDDQDDAFLVQEMLSEVASSNFQLTRVQDLAEAQERLEKEDFEVILLDLMLPETSGLDTFTRAREAAADLPIVVMTGLDDEDLAKQAVREGAQDFLLKGRSDSKLLCRTLRFAVERQRAQERLSRIAHYDGLTGLPNRILLRDRLYRASARADRRDSLMALLFVGIDHFRRINESLGHDTGDNLLKAVGRRLQGCLREVDTVARWGGDEFAIIIEDLRSPGDAGLVAQEILDTLSSAFDLKNHEIFITASIGITVYPWDSREDLFKDADAAMYRAKAQGRNNFQYYTLEMLARTSEQSMLESYLHHALQRDEFQLHYQPVVDLRSRRIVAVVAMPRWQHPELGPVPTADFLPVAEKTGLIVPIGEWVFRDACGQCRAWHQAGLAPIRMAVSVSARQLRQRDFADMVKRALEETGLAPEYLEIQITEGFAQEDIDRVSAALSHLKDLNVRVVLDDFGTGSCSLKYLKELPFDAVKIDRSFINNIDTEPTNAAIAIAIISLSRALDKEVIAAGVETEDELAFLRIRDAMTGQGNLFSYPLPAHSIEECLKTGPILENSDLH